VRAIRDEARRRRIALETTLDFWPPNGVGRPTLMLGYAQTPEPTIRAGIRELGEVVRACRGTEGSAGRT
jgi:DNA-binding transcriptional MocR family regulator